MTQETMELKVKLALDKIERSGFDMTSYKEDLKEQENIDDYEEIYDSLKHYIDCSKGINLLKEIERNMDNDEKLDENINDIIEVLNIFRNNRELLKKNNNIDDLKNKLYSVSYKVITKEILNSLDSIVFEEIEKDEYDLLKLSEFIFEKRIKGILDYKEEYDENLVKKLQEKIREKTRSNDILIINKEIIVLVVSIYNTEIIRKNSIEIFKKTKEEYIHHINEIIASESTVEKLANRKENKSQAKKKNDKSIKNRILAFLASLGILVSVSNYTHKSLKDMYTSYETVHTVATQTDGKLEIKTFDSKYFPKIDGEKQAVLSVYYDKFETASGTKQFVEEFYLPTINVSEIENYINIDLNDPSITLKSSKTKDSDIFPNNTRQISLYKQNLENFNEDKVSKFTLGLIITLVDLIISCIPYMPLDDIIKLKKLLKKKKMIDENYYEVELQIMSYLSNLDLSINECEHQKEIYNRLKELTTLINIQIEKEPFIELSFNRINEAKENSKVLRNN